MNDALKAKEKCKYKYHVRDNRVTKLIQKSPFLNNQVTVDILYAYAQVLK